MESRQLTSVSKLYALYPNAVKGIFEMLSVKLNQYKFSLLDIENFLAHCAHESAGFSKLEENLNYSAQGLTRTFGKYFKNKDLKFYAGNPQRIANLVYANRMGNGSEQSGDGYKYRGRGIIQITGRKNYTNLSSFVGHNCIEDPDFLSTVEGAVMSAIWFWRINMLSGTMTNEQLTMRINGGLNGLQDRIHQLERIRKFLRTKN